MQTLAFKLFIPLALSPLVFSLSQQEVLRVAPEAAACTFDTTSDAVNTNASFLPKDTYSTFPYDSKSTDFTTTTLFVRNLYQGIADKKPWILNAPAGVGKDFPWMVSRIGNAELTPDGSANPAEPVANRTNPSWRWRDVWRPLNLYKNLLGQKAAGSSGSGFVVDELLKGLSTTDKLTTALFPADVQKLLVDNEKVIVASKQEWVGFPANATRPKQYAPFPGVKVSYAAGSSGAAFKQTGAVGPMSLEASFILATQLAGINWKKLLSKIGKDEVQAGVYWAGAIIPENKNDQVIKERRQSYPTAERNMGWLSRVATSQNTGSPDAGFYLVLDIDPKVNGFDPKINKNVFVFAAHPYLTAEMAVIDPHSRVYVKDTDQLQKLVYATPYAPATTTPPQIATANKGEHVRFYAHAHSAVLPYTDWMNWVGQELKPGQSKGEPMPVYSQIGEMHLYFLSEDEASVWPRLEFIQKNS
ncbi:hypothetical protein BC835DRAFT_1303239 [Cytidiella melzeri]|nr:hypothetical protein BC835DRAFT_1303239 [Cytidiella melzeri]